MSKRSTRRDASPLRLVEKDGRRARPTDNANYAAWVCAQARKIRPEDYTPDPNKPAGTVHEPASWEAHDMGFFTDGRDGSVHRISSLIRYPEGIIFIEGRKKGDAGEYRSILDPFASRPEKSGRAAFIVWLSQASENIPAHLKAGAETLVGLRRWKYAHALLAVDIVAETYRPFYATREEREKHETE